MKAILAAAAIVAAAGVGFGAGRTNVATAAVDEHAGHDMSAPAAVAMASQAAQQGAVLAPSGATAADRLAKSQRHGEWVAIKVGATDSVMAWVVYPERRDKAPVVIAIHENTGLNTWNRSIADQLAADGFIGIAPDLTTMQRTPENLKSDWAPDAGRAAIGTVTAELGNAMIDAVAKYGMSLPAAQPKYGIIGFCWGGGRSFLHATHSPSLGASVVFYGSPPSAEAMANIKAPVLGLYGGNDARINATIPATDSTMKRLGKSYEFHIFEGAGHGFLRGQESSPANLAAAQQAWPKTVAFLKSKLGN